MRYCYDMNVRTKAFIAVRHNGHAATLGAHWTQVTERQKYEGTLLAQGATHD